MAASGLQDVLSLPTKEAVFMPEARTKQRARQAKRSGKSPSTQAGEYVREEVRHVRQGKHGARNPKQAIAIGLSKARRAGVDLPAPKRGSRKTKAQAQSERARPARRKTSTRRSQAVRGALKREGRAAGSRRALSNQARSAARRRTAAQRSASARKAARTKGPAGRQRAARKAARTRARRSA
jgi:hypothetical protein